MPEAVRDEALTSPALVIDLEALDANIAAMAAHARAAGVVLRPHAKSHKCPEIARRLAAAGAVGASCATLAEAEALAAAGIGGLLVTSPVAGPEAMGRIARLLLRGADLSVVVDDPAALDPLAAAARAAVRDLPVLAELDVGQGRTGCATPEAAVALARAVATTPGLCFAGVHGYWGHLQQATPRAERLARIEPQAERLRALVTGLAAVGLPAGVVTGGGTGTSFLDPDLDLFTEIQPGSYLFLDSAYGALDIDGSGRPGAPFAPALAVSALVVSAIRPGRAIVAAGLKAFATDSGHPEPLRGAPPGAVYGFMGDEHGALDHEPGGGALRPGDRVEFLVSHCDPTVNLYSSLHVRRGVRIVDVWPIAGRY